MTKQRKTRDVHVALIHPRGQSTLARVMLYTANGQDAERRLARICADYRAPLAPALATLSKRRQWIEATTRAWSFWRNAPA